MFVTPITRGEYLIGKVTPYALLAVLQMSLIAFAGIFWFRVPFHGTFAAVAAGLGLFMLTVIGLGLLVSLVSHTRQQAQQTVLFIMMPMMLLSGFIFPIESMPAALVPVTYAMPLTWAVLLMRGVFVKGVGFSGIIPELAVLAIFAAVIFGIALLATRRRLSE
jgi:ABC-2 type transport system permease protein